MIDSERYIYQDNRPGHGFYCDNLMRTDYRYTTVVILTENIIALDNLYNETVARLREVERG